MTIAVKSLKEFVETAKTVSLSYHHEAKERWHRGGFNEAAKRQSLGLQSLLTRFLRFVI